MIGSTGYPLATPEPETGIQAPLWLQAAADVSDPVSEQHKDSTERDYHAKLHPSPAVSQSTDTPGVAQTFPK